MALDPSIILQAGRGVTPLESPLDIQAKVTQLRGMQQAQGMAPAQMDLQRQKVQADADKFRMEMQQHVDKLNKEQREETRRRALDMGKAADWIKAGGLEAPMRWDKAAVSLGLPEYVGKYDPSQLDLLKIQAMTMTDLLKENEGDTFTGWHEAIGEGGKPGIFQTSKKGEVRQVPGVKPVPPSRGVTGVQLGAVTGTLTDPGEERIAQMVADGRLAAPPMSRNNPRNLRIIARADQISQERGSGLDAATFPTRAAALKFFTTGRGADAFRQQETILHHAKVFEQIAEALDNGNVQLANKLGTQFGAQFGSDKPTNYKMAGQIFSAEVGKYLAGSQSTQAERAELAELIPVFSSPEQFRGGLKTLSNLVEGQRKSWQRQKEAALKGLPTDTKDDAHGEAGPKRIKNDAEYNALPSGTVFIAPDGKTRRKP